MPSCIWYNSPTRYAFLNSVRLIDVPGEFSVEPSGNPKTSRLYILPPKLENDVPAGVCLSRRPEGIALQKASHVVVQGFHVRQQGNASSVAGITARGPAENVTIRDCEVSQVRGGAAITTFEVNKVLVDRCNVHHCPGHTKGIVLRNASDVDTKNCTLTKNSSTGLDYYTITRGTVSGNTITDHRGMHANSFTFYLGCKDITIENNRASNGNVALTFQEAENFTIRNNLFDGNGRSTVVGIWTSPPVKNIRILHNAFIRSGTAQNWSTGLFTNSKSIQGLIVQNNIIDGLASDNGWGDAVFSHNLYTRMGPAQDAAKLGTGERFEPDLRKIFVDPEKNDFRLRAGSPALSAGTNTDTPADMTGVKRAGTPDIGPYQSAK